MPRPSASSRRRRDVIARAMGRGARAHRERAVSPIDRATVRRSRAKLARWVDRGARTSIARVDLDRARYPRRRPPIVEIRARSRVFYV
jgi:hypothetical protein